MIRQPVSSVWLEELVFGGIEKTEKRRKLCQSVTLLGDAYPGLCPACPLEDVSNRWFTTSGLFAISKYYEVPSAVEIQVHVKSDLYHGQSMKDSLMSQLRSLFKKCIQKRELSEYRFKRSIPEAVSESENILQDTSLETIDESDNFKDDTYIIELVRDTETARFKIVCEDNQKALQELTQKRLWAQDKISYCPVCRQSFLKGQEDSLKPNDSRLPESLYPDNFINTDIWTFVNVLDMVQLLTMTRLPVISKILPRLRSESPSVWNRSFNQEKKIKEEVKKKFNNLLDSDNWFEMGKALINLGYGIKPEFESLNQKDIDDQLELWEHFFNTIDSYKGKLVLSTPKVKTAGLLLCMALKCFNFSKSEPYTEDSQTYGEKLAYFLSMPSYQDDISEAFGGIFNDEEELENVFNTLFCQGREIEIRDIQPVSNLLVFIDSEEKDTQSFVPSYLKTEKREHLSDFSFGVKF